MNHGLFGYWANLLWFSQAVLPFDSHRVRDWMRSRDHPLLMRYITNLAAASREGFFPVIIYVQVFLDRSTRFDFCPTLNVGQKSILKVGRSVQTVSTRSNIFLEQRKSPMEVGQRLDPIQLDSTSIRQAFDLLSALSVDKVADLFKWIQHSSNERNWPFLYYRRIMRLDV